MNRNTYSLETPAARGGMQDYFDYLARRTDSVRPVETQPEVLEFTVDSSIEVGELGMRLPVGGRAA